MLILPTITIAWMSTWCWVISTFYDFCGFWFVAVNTVDKLQFLICTFSVLLSKLCNVSLCNYIYWIYLSSFLILETATVCHIRLSKIKTLHQVPGTNMHQSAKFRNDRSNSCINKKILYILTNFPKSPPWMDLHKLWHSCRGRRRNHLLQIFGDRLRGVDSVGVENCHLPLSGPVAVNTGQALYLANKKNMRDKRVMLLWWCGLQLQHFFILIYKIIKFSEFYKMHH